MRRGCSRARGRAPLDLDLDALRRIGVQPT